MGIVLLTVGLYCAFFYLFRDFGPAVVIVVLTLTALYAATGRLFTPLALGLSLAAAIGFTVWKDLGFHTLRNRVEMWLDPWHTYFIHGDHLARILWGIAAGGWFGMGVGSQDLARQIPLARNDAAFAGVAASMGFWTALCVLGLFAAITWRGMLAARQAPTDRTRLLAFCLTSLLAFQAVWIAGAMVRVFPFTGINLPFISTGLSNMIASALALGTIWNISRTSAKAGSATDATEATPEILAGVTRLARPVTALFALPAIGVTLYGCPWLLGDRTLETTAYGVGRGGERAAFGNPYLEQFRRRFQRGRIFSADGRLLAFSDPSPEELAALRADAPNFAAYVTERMRAGNTEGARFYPLGSTTAQLVGWTPHGEFMAREGSVETSFDGLLRGYNPHQLPFYFRTRNNPLVRPPEAQDLQLTIVAELQQYVRERLARAVKDARGSGGAAVVYDVATGAVLAAATAPTFDPNGLNTERMKEYVKQDPRTRILTNKALARDARYFPGSTFKVLTAAAGIAEGVTGSATCRNGRNAEPITWEYEGRRWRRDAGRISDYARGSHGTLGLEQGMEHALAVSCNVFFGELAAKLGPERLRRAMSAAELSSVPSTREISEHLPYAGFGQIVVKTSPLEMAMLAAAAGTAREESGEHPVPAARPHWVQAVVNRSGKREPEGVFGAPDRRPYRPFSDAAALRLRKMMVGVVEDGSGTAHAAFYRGGEKRLPGITVGGKTGTAEFDKIETSKRTGKKRTVTGRHAWFIGFARSDHELEPRTLAFAVLVEDVRRGGTGGTVCAPVARDLIAKILPAPGASSPLPFQGLERFYQQQVRPRLGPFAGIADWLRTLIPRR
jgi:peptidoglycan glycosyltransferase